MESTMLQKLDKWARLLVSNEVPLGESLLEYADAWRKEVEELSKRTTWRTDQPPKDRPIRICVDYPQGYLGERKAYGWMPLPEVE